MLLINFPQFSSFSYSNEHLLTLSGTLSFDSHVFHTYVEKGKKKKKAVVLGYFWPHSLLRVKITYAYLHSTEWIYQNMASWCRKHIMRVTLIIRKVKSNFNNRLNTNLAGNCILTEHLLLTVYSYHWFVYILFHLQTSFLFLYFSKKTI